MAPESRRTELEEPAFASRQRLRQPRQRPLDDFSLGQTRACAKARKQFRLGFGQSQGEELGGHRGCGLCYTMQ